jgi:hypothetical protein
MGRTSPQRSSWFWALLCLPVAVSCANKPNHATSTGGGDTPTPTANAHQPPPSLTCDTPQTGCPCDTQGDLVDCGSVKRRSADYVSCSMGQRVCEDGAWSACEGDKISEMTTGTQPQALGSSAACVNNPCDPYCQIVVDDARNLALSDPGLTAQDGGLALTAVPPDPNANNCTGIKLDPPTQTLTVTQINPSSGLYAEYFNQRSATITSIPTTWVPTATRVDSSVNFDWGSGAPGVTGIGVDNFTVRWTGNVNPPASGDYVFYTRSDDGARLWINGVQVINKWIDQGATEWPSAPITLTQGTPAVIQMEYYENGGGASAQLEWSSAAISKSVIPETYLTPASATLMPFVTSPTTAALTVSVVPPTCYEGTFSAAWGLDTLDRATVSSSGAVTLQTPVAGTINVSAYVQEFKDTATVNVVVAATDVLQAPTGAPAIYTANMSSGADTATIVYPYDGTVLPLALKPPVLQWDTGGVAAAAVKVTLRYPATGTAIFKWSKIIAEPSNARFAFTRDVWNFFERTAKAGTGKISLQRIVGTQLTDALSKNVTFASTPLRGKIFYTQYGGGSNIMRLDPGGDIPAAQAFPTSDGCPVCHSMSADGTKFATSNWSFSTTNAGISKVDAAGNLTVLSDFPNPNTPYGNGGNDWRGFAWAPLTPDGKYIFATNNIFGNTNQTVVGIDTSTRLVSLPAAMVSGGRGSGLLADYYSNTTFSGNSWRRVDARPDFDWTASPGGPVPADGFSVVWDGQVEGYYTEAHTFEVETSAGVRLTVGGNVIIDKLANNVASKFTGVANLVRGQKTSINLRAIDMNAETIVKLRWSSAQVPYTLIPQSMLYPSGGQHGAVATYTDTAGHGPVTRLESDLAYDWGNSSPAMGRTDTTQNITVDNFFSKWDALVEAPATTNLQWCINSDDGYVLYVDGVNKLSGGYTSGNYVCTTAMAVTAGQKYLIHVDHTEGSGGAKMTLAWQMSSFITTREDIPMARIFPPVSFTAPTTGLSATFYDTMDFGGALLATNNTTPQAYTTYVPTLDYDWGGDRMSFGRALTSSDTMSGRFTGRIQPACTGIHEFEIWADDTAMLWIGSERVMRITSGATKYGAIWLDSNLLYDFKLDWTENGGSAGIRVRWKPSCNGATSYSVVPQANFRPTGDTTLNGYLRQGGDNGNGYPYVAWQTPNAVGVAPVDVSAQSPGTWGLGNTAMMVPTFSPDAKKLVFVDGDSATNAGWRKGLSTFDFDQAGKLFKNRRQMLNNFPYGDVIKWPTFESDSRSVIYQTTTPGDSCCRNTSWTKYGFMGPTNYFEDPGRLWSLDTASATPTPVLLSKANDGERVMDHNKSYQATMLPTAAGGYRWAVFTSTRPYGNTINLPAIQQNYSDVNNYTAMLNTSVLQSMLWVSAVDDTVSGATDRSHPAFFLPNQAYSESGGHYLNERAYWVTEACRAPGASAASTCDVDEDCCGGTSSPKTGVCRIDTPVTQPPTRHCAAVPPPNACIAANGACSSSTDCCFNYPCVSNICVKPPPLPTYRPDNFVRDYTAECGRGTLPVWRFFDWKAVTPPIDSAIEIYAESVADPSAFHSLPPAPTVVAIAGVVQVATVTGATIPGWVGQDVGLKLKTAGFAQRKYLRITARLIPNTKITSTPVMTDWRQAYSCPPSE